MELTKEEREILRQNILDRYDNEEYWDLELLEEVLGDFYDKKSL